MYSSRQNQESASLAIAANRARWAASERLILGFTIAVAVAVVCSMKAQSDTFWQLRAGADIWRTGAVPSIDSYSYAAAGQPWPDHSWLWQALTYPLYRLGGMPLLTFGAAAFVLAALALAYRSMIGTTWPRSLLMLPAIFVVAEVQSLRPQCLTLFMLALLLWLLVHERFLFITPVFLVWANGHGGVTLGFAVLGAAFATALLRWKLGGRSDARRVRRLGGLLVTCSLAMCATPLGFGLWPFVLQSEARLHQASISEWLPPFRGEPLDVVFWIAALGFGLLLILRRQRLSRLGWPDSVSIAVALLLMLMAARSLRQIGPFALVAAVAASRLLGEDFRLRSLQAAVARYARPRVAVLFTMLVSTAAVFAVGTLWSRSRADWTPLSQSAIQAVRECKGPLYNNYYEGGFLIWWIPERRVLIDNRQDPFALSFILEHSRVETGKNSPEPMFARYGIRCAFVSVESKLQSHLDEKGWQTRFRDESYAVLEAPR